jgi:hypothetical protein
LQVTERNKIREYLEPMKVRQVVEHMLKFMLIYDQFIMMLDDKSFRKCVCVFAPLKQDQKSI